MRYCISYFKSVNGNSCHALIKFKELEDMNDTLSRMKLLDANVLQIKNHQRERVIEVNYDLPHDPRYTFLSYGVYWCYFTVHKNEMQKRIFEFDSDEEALLFFEVYDG